MTTSDASALTDAEEVEVVAVVEGARLTVDVVPVLAHLVLLVERRVVGTQEAEVLHLHTVHFYWTKSYSSRNVLKTIPQNKYQVCWNC